MANKTIKVTLTGSGIGRKANQRATIKGLGFNKVNQTKEIQDTPENRGMINTISHLVRVEEAS
jgi:large subunit ribosomal protein L30